MVPLRSSAKVIVSAPGAELACSTASRIVQVASQASAGPSARLLTSKSAAEEEGAKTTVAPMAAPVARVARLARRLSRRREAASARARSRLNDLSDIYFPSLPLD